MDRLKRGGSRMIKLYRVGVKFRDPWEADYGSKTYHYYSAYKIHRGDIVIVETKYGPQVAKVVQENIPSASFTGSSSQGPERPGPAGPAHTRQRIVRDQEREPPP